MIRALAAVLLPAVAAASSWLKPYPVEPYAQIWHVRVRVKSLDRAMPGVIKALEGSGGESTIPLKNAVASKLHGYQQLSFRISERGAEKSMKRLSKLGVVQAAPPTLTGAADPQVGKEIEDRLRELDGEAKTNRPALERMPAISTVTSELVEQLTAAKKVHDDAKGRVLVNLEIFEEAAPGR